LEEDVVMDAYWWGLASGVVLAVVVLVLLVRFVDPPGESTRTINRRNAYRLWCARNGWCPVHDVADGQCPPVDTWVGHAQALGACRGSATVVLEASLTPTGVAR
jgi:hypothetical protein